MSGNQYNKDVPDSAIIKQLLIENGKLKSEVAYLENELECKKKAISAFKEWQKKLVKYQFQYWLNEGVKMIDNPPSEKVLNRLRSIAGCRQMYDVRLKKLEKLYNAIMRVTNKENEDNLLRDYGNNEKD